MDVSAPAPRSKFDLVHGRAIGFLAGVIAVCMALYHMWVILTGTPEAIIFRGTHLLFAIVLTFLLVRRTSGEAGQAPSAVDYALLARAGPSRGEPGQGIGADPRDSTAHRAFTSGRDRPLGPG